MLRPGWRRNRGSSVLLAPGPAAAASVVVSTPVTIMGSDCVEWWRADLGNTIAADGNWVGQVAGVTFAQAVSLLRPVQSANGGPNSTPMMTFDGTAMRMDATLVRAAPGTTPMIVWAIVQQLTWAANKTLFSDAGGTGIVLQRTASPQLAMSAGVIANNNSGIVVAGNPWGRLQASFAASAGDELLCIASSVTGASGNNAGTAPIIGVNAGGTNFCNFGLAELVFMKLKPTGQKKTDMDAYVTGRYGGGLV